MPKKEPNRYFAELEYNVKGDKISVVKVTITDHYANDFFESKLSPKYDIVKIDQIIKDQLLIREPFCNA